MTIADLIVNDMSYEKHHPTLSLLIDSSKTSKLEELLLEWKLEMCPKCSHSVKIEKTLRIHFLSITNDSEQSADSLCVYHLQEKGTDQLSTEGREWSIGSQKVSHRLSSFKK
jgi:hypothetical protein